MKFHTLIHKNGVIHKINIYSYEKGESYEKVPKMQIRKR